MPPLPTNLRRDLERAIVAARTAAELGARSALGALTVPDARVGNHLDAPGRALRNRLRAHARQLGDKRSAKGEQTIDRLVRECAYEHWHRMLFARFLAENDLLIEPASGVSVSLDEVEELARDKNINPWELASRFAQRMLPQIFRPGDPVLAIDLPTETRLKLESLLESLPPAVFTAADSLGWVYQFWQSAEKDAVNARVKSGEKITGATLPAVTQLFTEHYMVLFLLHNTVGAWRAGKMLAAQPELATTATSEQELRDAVRLSAHGGYDFQYLRFVRAAQDGDEDDSPTGPWRPAAGAFDGWPRNAKEITILDPCCGSGHFIVAAFSLLVRLRMEEESLSLEDSIRATIADNLFGLELDARCTQIAAFNLAIAAWKLAGKPIDLPPMRIACSGVGPQATKEEWLKLADSASAAWNDIPAHAHEFIRNGLLDLHETFSKAPDLGSLIDPAQRSGDLITADYETLKPFLDAVFKAEAGDDEQRERAVAAKGMTDAAQILVGPASGYTLITTNYPFAGLEKLGEHMTRCLKHRFDVGRRELATGFLLHSLVGLQAGGVVAAVMPGEWTYLRPHRYLRERLLKNTAIRLLAHLGRDAFQTGLRVSPVLVCLSPGNQPDPPAVLDVRKQEFKEKPHELATAHIQRVAVSIWQSAPDCRMTTTADVASNLATLSDIATGRMGMMVGDGIRFERRFWELATRGTDWELLQGTSSSDSKFTGRDSVVLWERAEGQIWRLAMSVKDLNHSAQNWQRGRPFWGHRGVVVSPMGTLSSSIYTGEIFDCRCIVLVPKEDSDLLPLTAFCLSGALHSEVRKYDDSLKVGSPKTLLDAPIDMDRWREEATMQFGEYLPEPQSDDPTQWLFHGRPERAEANAVLQVGVARLLGYRWPGELDTDMRLAPEARALVERCKELADHADEDGIVCLSPVRTEASAVDRLRRLLADAFGAEWSNDKERSLLQAAADKFNKGAVAGSLDEWLRERFFVEHCKLFHHRPFIWHIWDGRKDGFSALVNYHKLAGPEGEGRRTLEALTYSYLGDWIQRQQAAVKSGEAGAEARLATAMELKEQLVKILEGEPPYDLFVRWKPLHEQAIGWAPDINDGVRLNIRPFMSATLSKGRRGAGVLRWKPNIKWGPKADRGKEPQSLRPRADFPWFWSWDETTEDFSGAGEYDGNRWNDLHYSNEFKQAARERAAEEVAP